MNNLANIADPFKVGGVAPPVNIDPQVTNTGWLSSALGKVTGFLKKKSESATSTIQNTATDAFAEVQQWGETLQDRVTKIVKSPSTKKNTSEQRISSTYESSPVRQGETPNQESGCAWYNLPCKVNNKIAEAAQSAGGFVSSTLTKVIIIVALLGVLYVFVMSYAQAKGASYVRT